MVYRGTLWVFMGRSTDSRGVSLSAPGALWDTMVYRGFRWDFSWELENMYLCVSVFEKGSKPRAQHACVRGTAAVGADTYMCIHFHCFVP